VGCTLYFDSCVKCGSEGAYLLVELRQMGLGSILDRHVDRFGVERGLFWCKSRGVEKGCCRGRRAARCSLGGRSRMCGARSDCGMREEWAGYVTAFHEPAVALRQTRRRWILPWMHPAPQRARTLHGCNAVFTACTPFPGRLGE